MTTTIKFEFNNLSGGAAETLAHFISGYIEGRHTTVELRGYKVVTGQVPETTGGGLTLVNNDEPEYIGYQEVKWIPEHASQNVKFTSPAVAEPGDGVTWGYASDRYAGTIVRVSATGKSIWFTRDDTRRVDDNDAYSESQTYEYKPRPGSETYMARWNEKRRRYMLSGKYPIGPGRHAYRSPHV